MRGQRRLKKKPRRFLTAGQSAEEPDHSLT
jgi:hypothetical protein